MKLAAPMACASFVSFAAENPPHAEHGEGDHPKGGGGVTGTGLANYPSTPLRGVPLPIFDGED